MSKKIIILVLFTLMVPFSIFSWIVSQNEWNSYFDKWDMDKNNYLDPNEFNRGFMDVGLFQKLDGNNDGKLGTNEFDLLALQIFTTWDKNNNGALDSTEFIWTPLTKDVDLSWDANNDGLIQIDEFRSGMYKLLDTDGNNYVEANELTNGLFKLLDVRWNNRLTRSEFYAGSGTSIE